MDGPFPLRLWWSPDGRFIAFTAITSTRISDERELLYLLPAAGGEPRRLLPEIDRVSAVSWSRDSASLYFARPETDKVSQIWKLRLSDGEIKRITRQGGIAGQESADGKLFYFINEKYGSEVRTVPVEGGAERLLVEQSVSEWSNFAVGAHSIYCLAPADEIRDPRSLRRIDLKTGESREIAKIERDLNGLQLSADERYLLFGSETKSISRMVWVEGLRK